MLSRARSALFPMIPGSSCGLLVHFWEYVMQQILYSVFGEWTLEMWWDGSGYFILIWLGLSAQSLSGKVFLLSKCSPPPPTPLTHHTRTTHTHTHTHTLPYKCLVSDSSMLLNMSFTPDPTFYFHALVKKWRLLVTLNGSILQPIKVQ